MAAWLGELFAALAGAVVDWLGEDVGETDDEEETATQKRETERLRN